MLKNEFKKVLLFFLFLNIFVNSYVVLPFKREQKVINSSITIEKQLEYYLEKDKIISTISFGEEPKGLELYLSLNEYTFFLSNDACFKNTKTSYNPLLSQSFKNTTDYIDLFVNIKKYCRAIEKCSIYNDIYLNSNITINNIQFLFGINSQYGKLDNSSKITSEDVELLELLKDKSKFILINKSDINSEINQMLYNYANSCELMLVSAKQNQGINELFFM